MTVTLLLPTLNEIDGFKSIFRQIDRSLFDDILVVDGRSTDGTVEYAISQGLRVMTQLRKGLGPGVCDAIHTLKTDYVIEFSLDGNCLPEHLPELARKLKEGYDLVIVSRYLPPARSHDDTLVTRFGNWIFSKMTAGLGPFPVTNALGMFRGFRISLVRNPEFEELLRGPVYEPLTSALANLRCMKIAEIPGDEPRRLGGVSKMSVIFNGSCILLMILRCYLIKFGLRHSRQT
jgi:glycosyltransferase involved in cell wall biosynthesis